MPLFSVHLFPLTELIFPSSLHTFFCAFANSLLPQERSCIGCVRMEMVQLSASLSSCHSFQLCPGCSVVAWLSLAARYLELQCWCPCGLHMFAAITFLVLVSMCMYVRYSSQNFAQQNYSILKTLSSPALRHLYWSIGPPTMNTTSRHSCSCIHTRKLRMLISTQMAKLKLKTHSTNWKVKLKLTV